MCNKYGDYMMRYMDGILGDFEEMNLKKHMEACAVCREDFAVYSEILQGFRDFSETQIVEAPADFAPAVMAKITALNLYAPKKGRLIDALIFSAWTILALALFGGTALALFGTEILGWLQGIGLYGIADGLNPLIAVINNGLTAITDFFANMGYWPRETAIFYSIVFLLVFVALVALQLSMSQGKRAQRLPMNNE
jgi:hypothetical protein